MIAPRERATTMTRTRRWLTGSIAVLLTLPVLAGAAAAQPARKVLRFVPQYESTVLDPVTSILQVTHQTALLPYDTLLARDAAGEVPAQKLRRHQHYPARAT